MSTKASNTTERPGKKNDQIISYYELRVLIGAAGILLPLLLFVGKLIYNGTPQLEFSISDYYDNGMAGDILVGVLFALGFFLLSYRGYDAIDSRAANWGFVFALGVALCPTTSEHDWVHKLHFVFALLLFSVFIFFSIYLFRRSDPQKSCTKQKETRNKAYLVCGIIMIVCVVGIAICSFLLQELSSKYQLVFWLETIALIAFGFSWITKAEFLFWKDEGTDEKKAQLK
jgi:uncharacterized membrane protein